MGCASSAPFMGEGGALGEIKDAANNMVESGEHALHDMGEAAGKTINEAIDHVKGAVSTASHGLQDAASHLGGAKNNTKELSNEMKKDADVLLNSTAPHSNGNNPDACRFIPLKSMSEEADDMKNAVDEIMNTPPHSPSSDIAVPPAEMFRPTPAPSFDKPPTPSATVLSIPDMLERPMEKIEETMANASLDELTDDLMKETENVLEETKAVIPTIQQDTESSENPTDLESDLPPTKWEALADAIVELPPRMSIDLGTGQLYVVVDDDAPPKPKYYGKPAVVKGLPNETHAAS